MSNQLYEDIMNKLQFEPSVNSKDITISICDGAVTLGGVVGSLYEKKQVEKSVKSIKKIRALENEIIVNLNINNICTNSQIAEAAINVLNWNFNIPSNHNIKIGVDKGWVTLTGTLKWQYQKNTAEHIVSNLAGVKGVENNICLERSALATDVKKKISEEFHRNATIDSKNIEVVVDGGSVTLKGKVKTWHEMKEAKKAAWCVSGVMEVKDELKFA